MGRGTRSSASAAGAEQALRGTLRAPADGKPQWVREHEPREVPDPSCGPQRVADLDPSQFGPGTRVQLTHLAVTDGGFDDTALLPPGTRGTIAEHFDPAAFGRSSFSRQIPIQWDNGSSLMACDDDQLVRLVELHGVPEPTPAPLVAGAETYRHAREVRQRLHDAFGSVENATPEAAQSLGIDLADLRLASLAGEDEQTFKAQVLAAHRGPVDLLLEGRSGATSSVRASDVELRDRETLAVHLDLGSVQSTMIVRVAELLEARAPAA